VSSYPYTPPVDQLLQLGDARYRREWPDYLGLGLDSEHVPDLIRMAIDSALNDAPSDSLEVWAPAHAWCALARLHAAEATEPLTQSLAQRREEALLYRQLASLRHDVPLQQRLSDLKWQGAHSQLKELCHAMGDERIAARISRWR
jgi:hypothetical protein